MLGTGLFAPICQRLRRPSPALPSKQSDQATSGDGGTPPELAAFLNNIPNLHTWDDGKTWNTGGFDRYLFNAIHKLIGDRDGLSFLETGAGNSTIFFLLHYPARVVSIAPDAALFDRIEAYCQQHAIPTASLEKQAEGSQWALPRLAQNAPPSIDFALIDGDHNWPMVFVDFHYVNYLVRPGGYILIDDTQLYSVGELVALLKDQWGYDVALDLGKLVVFRKHTDAREMPGFGGQPYIMRRSGLTPTA
jgi:Methyltransferase domain